GRFLKYRRTPAAPQPLLAQCAAREPGGVPKTGGERCACYLEAPRQLAEEGTHTVSVDEMTGIQALERIAATKPMRPGQEERREFEYKRHGTQCLIGNFEVATGAVITPTVQATRTEQDFAVHIAATVATDPE